MKRSPIWFLLIALFLTACQPAEFTAAPIQQTSEAPTNGETAEVSTITPTGAPTENPLAGAPNAEATGKDAQGFYKEVEGKLFRWMEIKNQNGEVEYSGWVFSLLRNGVDVPLLDLTQQNNDWGYFDGIMSNAFYSDNLTASNIIGSYYHTPNVTLENGYNLTSYLYTRLQARTGLNGGDLLERLKNDHNPLIIHFDTPMGSFDLDLNVDTEIITIIKNFNYVTPFAENGFSEWKHPNGRIFHSRVYLDQVGRVICEIASNRELTGVNLWEMLLYNFVAVIEEPNQNPQGFIPNVETFAEWAINGNPPHFIKE
ncbi:MAG: hypothetical protein FJZ87_11225 [Chloroflexi bacterium]|nr:hypothetical protein [Chloroflexota bacterium]